MSWGLGFFKESDKVSPYGSNTQEVQNKISELKSKSRLRIYASGLNATFNRSKVEGMTRLTKISAAILCCPLFAYGALNVLNDMPVRHSSKHIFLLAVAPAGMCAVATHEMYKNTIAEGYYSEISEILEMHTESKNLTKDQKEKVAKIVSAKLAEKGANKVDLEKKIDKKINFMLLSDQEKLANDIKKLMKIGSKVSKLMKS